MATQSPTDPTDVQHHAWLARSFGRTDYLMMTPEDLDAIAAAGEYITKYPGTHLFRQGTESIAAYVIHQGSVELYRGDRSESKVVTRVGPGGVIGDIAMFQGNPYHWSARAVDAMAALRLDRNKLLPLLIQRPVIALRWLVAGLSQLEDTHRRVLRLLHRSVLEQVADLLIHEADDFGEVNLSQASIATLLGASRQSVNEALGTLRSRGIVETGYRSIRLLNRAGAAEVAGL